MGRLNQLIAVIPSIKQRTQAAITAAYQRLKKEDDLAGIVKSYEPVDAEDLEKISTESKLVQVKVPDLIAQAVAAWTEAIDAVASQDYTNCQAVADVKVDDVVVLKKVPVTHLLYLEKVLVDANTFIEHLPVLNPSDEWSWDSSNGVWVTPSKRTHRTRKVKKSFVAHEGNDKHPPQVQVFDEDIIVGYYDTKKFNGAITAAQKNRMRERVRKYSDAVKRAREEANMVDVVKITHGEDLLRQIFSE